MKHASLFLLFVLLLAACAPTAAAVNSTSTLSSENSTSTVTIAASATPTETLVPTNVPATETPIPTATANETKPVLTPKDIANGGIFISILTYETGSKPSTSPIRRGDTYAELDVQYGPALQHWLITTAVFYKPGAGASLTQIAANETTDEFQVCSGNSDITNCKISSMDQLRNYELWAQKRFGDNDHIVKTIVNYPLDPLDSKALKANIKKYETDQVLYILSTPKTGGMSSWNNPIVEWALGQDPQLFNNLQNFASSADPSDFSIQ